jgi:hypothetical protein
MNYIPDTTETTVRVRTIEVQGLSIFYREAGKAGSPKLVMLHGFPIYVLARPKRGQSVYGYLGETPWHMEGGLSAHYWCAGLRPHESLVEDTGAYVNPTTLDTGGTL